MALAAPSGVESSAARIGRYEVLARLATGGMAEILLGRVHGPSGFERAVVIKRILPQYAELPSFVSMFLDEARIAARIHHPNVVQVHELGEEDGELFLVMEYLQGESSASLMRRMSALGKPIGAALCAHIIAEACAGLHAAHELKDARGNSVNLVHRDISPQNLFVTYDGGVKVLDFGIAKAADRISQTEAGTLKGKFEYMSPEQAEGLSLDRRSDIFALGVVLYELSTGRRLFKRGTAVESLRAVREGHVMAPSQVIEGYPPRLEEICLKALSHAPEDRYPTAAAMRRDLALLTRELAKDSLPSETLAATMREQFATRIDEKKRLMESVKRGSSLGKVPSAEVDIAVEIPAVELDERPTRELPSPVATAPGSSSSGRRWLWVALALVPAIAAGAWWLSQAPEADARPALVAAPPVTPDVTPEVTPEVAPTPEPGAVEPETVLLRIESVPAGASITLDGEPRGETPAEIDVPRGDEQLALRLELEGYRPLEREVQARMSQLLQLDLERAPRPGRSRRRAEPETPAPEPEPTRPVFRRFD